MYLSFENPFHVHVSYVKYGKMLSMIEWPAGKFLNLNRILVNSYIIKKSGFINPMLVADDSDSSSHDGNII